MGIDIPKRKIIACGDWKYFNGTDFLTDLASCICDNIDYMRNDKVSFLTKNDDQNFDKYTPFKITCVSELPASW